ncbi:MAG: hypothetical protein IH959_08095 [Chloroflexi bacterium]|nr:hypothetical protein [Chloroflexota bacterium]
MRLRQTLAVLGILIVIVTVTAVVLWPGTGPAAASTDPGGGEVAGLIADGSINGTVTEEGTGTPLAGICVNANTLSFEFFSFSTTDALGAYSVGGLGSGDYEVQFSDCRESPTHVAEWYNDQPSFETANLVAVTDGSKTSGIDAQLATGGSINGTVTEEGTGTPLADICVDAVDSSFAFFGFDITDASGAYSVGGLGSGDYEVQFFDCGESPTYITEWYNDQPDAASADLVLVTIGSKTSGIDAQLVIGGSINGTVTAEGTGAPLADICVDAIDSSFAFFGFDITDASGAYSIVGLAGGDYTVDFTDCGETVTYLAEFYDDQPDFDSATLVAVVAGIKTSGIDAELAVAAVVLTGDANCNGTVDSIDATIVLQFTAGLLGALACPDGADANGDGDITSVDATLILQFTAGLLDSLAVG